MNNLKISVIVPVYNASEYLKQCLNSLVNQTYENIEILLINDASTDNSLEILYDYQKKYTNIIIFDLEKNIRQGGARNIGIKASTGDYIIFVDSDDWIELNAISNMVSLLGHGTDIICSTSFYREYSNGITKLMSSGDASFISKYSGKTIGLNSREQLLYKGTGLWQNLYRRSLLVENNITFPEGLSYEDNYFVPMVYAYVNNFKHNSSPFYHYRENLNSTIFQSDPRQLNRIEIEKIRLNDFKIRGLMEQHKDGYEILAVKLYYLITLGTFYKFFRSEFIEKCNNLKVEFYKAFPYFKKNKYYKTDIPIKDRIKIIALDISPVLLFILFKINYMRDKR